MQLIDSNNKSTHRRMRAKSLPALLACWPPALLLLFFFFALPAQAQYSASLQGTVADAQGALIPGASVTLVDSETNRTLKTTSNSAGVYFFGGLAPSLYHIEATRDGFKKKAVENYKILAEQSNALNFQLEVGAAAESVTVNASTESLIDTATGTIGATISQNEMAKLPSFGRDPLQLIQLAPGMFGDGSQTSTGTNSLPGNQGDSGPGNSTGSFVTENKPQVFGNGGRNDTNGISLDGVGITSVTWGSAAVITPNEDSIKEMKVISNGYDAEWGHNSGAQIQITSQNGTNQYHGSAFFKLDRPGLNAYQRWDPNNNPKRDTGRFNDMGGTLGGPIFHNKLFGFFAYETIRNNGTATGNGWYETSSFDDASASGSIANKFLTLKGGGAVYSKILEDAASNEDCARVNLIQGVNCNWVQGKGLDIGSPLTIGLGKQDPSWAKLNGNTYTPGLGGDGTGSVSNLDGQADIMYVATEGPNDNINQQYNGRVDYQLSSKDLVAFDGYYVPVSKTSYNGANRASNIFYHNAKNYSMGGLWDRTISNTMLNAARVDMAGWKWNELSDNPQSPLGLPVASGFNFANLTQSSFGPSIGSVYDQWTFNVKDVVTKVYKSHALKFGGQFTRMAYLDEPTGDAEPSYSFENMWDFLNDAPFNESITADPLTGKPSSFTKNTRGNITAFFAQDDWTVKSNLTINLGLRWENFGGMTEKQGHLANLRLGTGADTLTGINFVLGGPEFNSQKANFGPQIGFAWSPARDHDKLVIRGGAGLGYNGLEYAITTNTRNNPPYLASSGSLSGSQILYATASDLYTFGALPANPNMITTFNSANLPTANVQLSVTGLPKNLPTAYVYRYSLQAQYDLGDRWVATLGYSGSMGRHLPLQDDLNKKFASQVVSGQMTYNPKLNAIDWYEDTGTSSFNSLLAELQHQFARTFQVDAQYRWGRSLDNGSGPYTTPDFPWMQGFNKGPSDFNANNMIKLWGLWSPVIFHGQNNWLEKVAGGWNFSGIMNWHSGFPFNPVYDSNCPVYMTSSNCETSFRPAAYLGGATTSQSIDTFKQTHGNFTGSKTYSGSNYFTMPAQPAGTLWPTDGTAPTPGAMPTTPGIGRNAFYGPRYFDTDFTVTKSFGLPTLKILGENARFEIRGNAFNLFNQLNLQGVDSTITDSTFGRATGVLGGRTISFEGHFKF
jgi:hypothetical protein